MNQFLKHDDYTDVITFDYSEGQTISGDIYISVERVKDNSSNLGINMRNELLRVMIHGTLHLIGYQDKKDYDKQKIPPAWRDWLRQDVYHG